MKAYGSVPNCEELPREAPSHTQVEKYMGEEGNSPDGTLRTPRKAEVPKGERGWRRRSSRPGSSHAGKERVAAQSPEISRPRNGGDWRRVPRRPG